jgi:hypothetical protein
VFPPGLSAAARIPAACRLTRRSRFLSQPLEPPQSTILGVTSAIEGLPERTFGEAPSVGYSHRLAVVDAELWQLVDRRLDEVRRLPYEELLRRTSGAPEVVLVERPSGGVCRRT